VPQIGSPHLMHRNPFVDKYPTNPEFKFTISSMFNDFVISIIIEIYFDTGAKLRSNAYDSLENPYYQHRELIVL
jgi:hypothetical protein